MVFGTDGIRGLVNKEISTELAYKVGRSMARLIKQQKLTRRVVIGKDTRVSSDAYVFALASALSDSGIDVVLLGVVPTPIVSYIVGANDFGGAIMVTASHNDYHYNGIKIFDNDGFKISKVTENEIEMRLNTTCRLPQRKGKIEYNESFVQGYIDYLFNTVGGNLSKYKLVVDCSNGANARIAPMVFDKLGAKVIKIGCSANGLKVNKDCGAGSINRLVNKVICTHSDFGIAFDGDGDRLVIVTSDGRVLSGDQLLLLYALYLKHENKLNNLSVVGTILTSKFVEENLKNSSITLLRSDVGDRNVIQMIKSNNLSVGGENSGHLCVLSLEHSCDALLNALFFFKCIAENKTALDEILSTNNPYIVVNKNIVLSAIQKENFCKDSKLKSALNKLQIAYSDTHIVVRPSGTEPILRIMVESKDKRLNEMIVKEIENIISTYI